jgi:hypothetical protein
MSDGTRSVERRRPVPVGTEERVVAGFLFRLETLDGATADPPTLSAAVPDWPIGSACKMEAAGLRLPAASD